VGGCRWRVAVGLWFRPAAVGMAVRHDTICLLRMRLTKPEVIAGRGCDGVAGAGNDSAVG